MKILLFLVFTVTRIMSQTTTQSSVVVAGGGGKSTAGGFSLFTSIGEPAVSVGGAGNVLLEGGFLPAGSASLSVREVGLEPGWNLLSVPLTVLDYHKGALYPTAISPAYVYERSYKVQDTLAAGEGFWLKFGEIQRHLLTGGFVSQDTIKVKAGWNIIGGTSLQVPISSIVCLGTAIRSLIFGYDLNYITGDTLYPGKGYWVKVSADGSLLVMGATKASIAPANAPKDEPFGKMNKLLVHDAMGKIQTLYVVNESDLTKPIDYYMLPPAPPEGCFDVRYASDRLVELLEKNCAKSVPIILSSAKYPVTLTWDAIRSPGANLRVNGKMISMATRGEITVASKNDSIQLEIKNTAGIPRKFALHQNYPNPFNPTTTLRFALPVQATVTLKVYNMLGQEVAVVFNNQQFDAGEQEVRFDATSLASGVYAYRIEAMSADGKSSAFTEVKRMMLVK